jgi:hypothetical protein
MKILLSWLVLLWIYTQKLALKPKIRALNNIYSIFGLENWVWGILLIEFNTQSNMNWLSLIKLFVHYFNGLLIQNYQLMSHLKIRRKISKFKIGFWKIFERYHNILHSLWYKKMQKLLINKAWWILMMKKI